MDNDSLKGKGKDIAGRVERQVGEWTGNEEHQGKGAAKQAEGKIQNAFGKAKDALKDDTNRDDAERRDDVDDRKSA